MSHIAILNYRYGSFNDPCVYLLKEIAAIWQEEGVKVSVLNGPGPRLDADLVISHVDLTVVPMDHVAYLRQYPRVMNGPVVDISKRMISAHVVDCPDDYDGAVITKSNRNCAGFKEAELAAKGILPQRYARTFTAYRVYPSTAEVPAEIWGDRDVVVEKFLPERRGGQYCLRTWVFFGNKETNSLSYAQEPIIKSMNVTHRVPIAKVPDELREIREELGFDYGKFDYAIVDGKVVLYDANRTPSLGAFSREKYMPTIKLFASGLQDYLAQ
jgi:hypothetical protein